MSPIWAPPSVADDPIIRLSLWSIRCVKKTGTDFFCGFNENFREGRVSTAIIELELIKRMGKTKSGRIYQLIFSPGSHPDAEYVWSLWCKAKGISSTEWTDVTKDRLAGKVSPLQLLDEAKP